jgi:hypothetical protein
VQTSVHPTAATPSAVVIGADEDAAYRTMSSLSIVGLVLGLAAPLTMFAPLLMVIPIAGVAVALLAIRRIALSEGTLIGRTAALIGLALSIASISAAFTRTELTQVILSRQARATAREWFDHLQAGQADQALLLMSLSRQSPPSTEPGEAPGGEPKAAPTPLESLRADPVAHFLLDHAAGAPVEFVRDTSLELFPSGEAQIQQEYSVGVPSETRDAPTTSVELVLQRSRGSNAAPSEWLVSAAKSDDLAVHADAHEHSADHVH